mmetsp:Transcript_26274/g.88314  ORF Transcript_26274/g.88314 Transcript_26274/m.88314 type:complete len:392 (+) Transcript_26274:6-1181(+)
MAFLKRLLLVGAVLVAAAAAGLGLVGRYAPEQFFKVPHVGFHPLRDDRRLHAAVLLQRHLARRRRRGVRARRRRRRLGRGQVGHHVDVLLRARAADQGRAGRRGRGARLQALRRHHGVDAVARPRPLPGADRGAARRPLPPRHARRRVAPQGLLGQPGPPVPRLQVPHVAQLLDRGQPGRQRPPRHAAPAGQVRLGRPARPRRRRLAEALLSSPPHRVPDHVGRVPPALRERGRFRHGPAARRQPVLALLSVREIVVASPQRTQRLVDALLGHDPGPRRADHQARRLLRCRPRSARVRPRRQHVLVGAHEAKRRALRLHLARRHPVQLHHERGVVHPPERQKRLGVGHGQPRRPRGLEPRARFRIRRHRAPDLGRQRRCLLLIISVWCQPA